MQLLRDNLTLWTSSDGGDAEGAAAGGATEAKEGEKGAKTDESVAAAAPSTEAAAETKPAETEAPAPTAS